MYYRKMAQSLSLVVLYFGLVTAACTTPAATAPQAAHPTAAVPTANVTATVIGVGQPLQAGVVTFTGMVVPSDGDFRIGGAVVERKVLTGHLPPRVYTAGLENNDPEWFVGAELRVTGLLEKVNNPSSPTDDQFVLRQVDSIAVAAPAVMIEGTLAPSKGFFQLASYLINRDDLRSALAPNSGAAGDQLRLWGQPHIVRCAPNAQCLLSGELPIFVIGRAQLLAH